MTKAPPPPTPERNRLRAAAALIPIIEAGLGDKKLSEERARQMAAFCKWTIRCEVMDLDEINLKEQIQVGLQRLSHRFLEQSIAEEN